MRDWWCSEVLWSVTVYEREMGSAVRHRSCVMSSCPSFRLCLSTGLKRPGVKGCTCSRLRVNRFWFRCRLGRRLLQKSLTVTSIS